MILWLDNNDNHKGAINENYGRELLELFSMGIGNYSEKDVKEACKIFNDEGVNTVAISFIWSVLNPSHEIIAEKIVREMMPNACLLYTSPSPRDLSTSRMPSSA